MSYRYVDSNTGIKANLIVIVILLALALVMHIASSIHDDSVWNYGYCDCGGQWVYQQAVGHRFSTCYIYECDKCGTIHEFNIKR